MNTIIGLLVLIATLFSFGLGIFSVFWSPSLKDLEKFMAGLALTALITYVLLLFHIPESGPVLLLNNIGAATMVPQTIPGGVQIMPLVVFLVAPLLLLLANTPAILRNRKHRMFLLQSIEESKDVHAKAVAPAPLPISKPLAIGHICRTGTRLDGQFVTIDGQGYRLSNGSLMTSLDLQFFRDNGMFDES